MMVYVWWIIVGGIAGWVASLITKSNNGLIMNVILGIIGAFVGSWLFGLLGITLGGGLISEVIVAAVGAIVLVAAARAIT